MNRRKFLHYSSLLIGATLIPVGLNGWVAKGLAQSSSTKKLIVVFLRGAADGLNIVVPYQDSSYYEARPSIALPPPGQEGGVINLDGYFGLHPALAPLMPLWQQRSLAFVHASGSPDLTRSHFDAQDYMESGTPGVKNTSTGWLNRLLGLLPRQTPVQALNLGPTTPRILAGQMPVANLPTGKTANRKMPIDTPAVNAAFDRLYSKNDPLSLAYQEGQQAREILLKELNKEMDESAQGAPSPVTFSSDARNLARLIRGDAKTQIGFIALGGWDSHVNQKGLLNRNLNPLAQGLNTLVQELGSAYKDTLIVIMSEFGRTVKENGNAGTDHGHGNVMWVLGGGIQGGKVYGQWPTLEESELHEGRDLAITTDFREVLISLLSPHLQLSPASLAQLFPGYTAKKPIPFWG